MTTKTGKKGDISTSYKHEKVKIRIRITMRGPIRIRNCELTLNFCWASSRFCRFSRFSSLLSGLDLWYLSPIFVPDILLTRETTSPVASSLARLSMSLEKGAW